MNQEPGSKAFAVVGVDGSDGSRRALEWAIANSDRFGSVTPVTVSESGPRVVDPDLVRQCELLEHRAGPGLVEASSEAGLLVVGKRGGSRLRKVLLGSVSYYCVKHSRVPVAVIPESRPTPSRFASVLVGVDGSPNADAALCWAVDHVGPGGHVTALASLNRPLPFSDAIAASSLLSELELHDHVVGVLAAEERRSPTTADVDFTTVLGDPRVRMREASREFDALVVGALGDRFIAYLNLGSVATALTRRAVVPTVVVPCIDAPSN